MKKPTKENKETLVIDSITITRAHVFDKGGCSFDAVINGISIYNLRVVESKNGDFIGFPNRLGNDGKYYNIVWFRLSDDDTKKIISSVEDKLNE